MATTSTDAANGSSITSGDEVAAGNTTERGRTSTSIHTSTSSTSDANEGDKKRKAAAISTTSANENDTRRCRPRPSTTAIANATPPTAVNATRNRKGEQDSQQTQRAAPPTEQQQLQRQQVIQQQLLIQLRQQQIRQQQQQIQQQQMQQRRIQQQQMQQQQIQQQQMQHQQIQQQQQMQQQRIKQQQMQQQWIQQQQQAQNQRSISFYAVQPCPGILEEPVMFFGFNDLNRYILSVRLQTGFGTLEYKQFNNLASALQYLHTPTATTTTGHGTTNTTNGNGSRNNEGSEESAPQATDVDERGVNRVNNQDQSTTPNNTALQKKPSEDTPGPIICGKALSPAAQTNASPNATSPGTTATRAPATSTEPCVEQEEEDHHGKPNSVDVVGKNLTHQQGLSTATNSETKQKDSSSKAPPTPTSPKTTTHNNTTQQKNPPQGASAAVVRGKTLSYPARTNTPPNTTTPDTAATKTSTTSTEPSIEQQQQREQKDPNSADVAGEHLASHEDLSSSTTDEAKQKDSSHKAARTPTRGRTLSLPTRINPTRINMSSHFTTPDTTATDATKTPAASTDPPTEQQEQEEQQKPSDIVARDENQINSQTLPGSPIYMAEEKEALKKARRGRARSKLAAAHFDKKLAELKAFKEEHGHLEPTRKTNLNLAQWLAKKRRHFDARQEGKESKITPEQIVALTDVGFSFTAIRRERAKPLKDMVAEYVEFVKKHGRFPRSSNEKYENRLFNAAKRWRQRHKLYTAHGIEKLSRGEKCMIPQEHVDTLNRINFNWEIKLKWSCRGRKNIKVPFEVNLEKLKAYRAKHGHCEPPKRHRKLGRFVLRQRQEYKAMIEGKRSSMTMERFRLLSEIDFRFKMAGPGHSRKRYVDDGSSGYDSSDDDDGSGDDRGQPHAPQQNGTPLFDDPMSD